MGKTKLTKKNFGMVMKTIREQANKDDNDCLVYVEALTKTLEALTMGDGPVAHGVVSAVDSMLDRLAMQDFFGTEAQRDPRGDQRE